MDKGLSQSGRAEFTALAVLCILAGALLTLDNLGILPGVWRLWPVFPLFLGLGGIWLFQEKRNRDIIAFGIGVFLVLSSIFFFVLNYTTWSLMRSLWPTFIGIFGTMLLTCTAVIKQKRWFAVSGIFFIFLSASFFVVFTIDVSLWPISIVLFGMWILLIPKRRK